MTTLATATRNATTDAVTALIDADSDPGYVEIRTGTSPGPNAGATGTLLVSIELNRPSFGAAAAGVATGVLSPELTEEATGTGTAGYFRVCDGSGAVVMDGTCGLVGSGADMELKTLAISTGLDVRIVAMTITTPAS